MILNKKFLISFSISILYLYYIFKFYRDINSGEVSYNYFNFNSLTNTILPCLVAVFPFLSNFKNRKTLYEFNLDKNHVYFILIFFISGLLIGGPGNTGRYVVFGSLLFLPLLNYQIFKIIRNLLTNIKKFNG